MTAAIADAYFMRATSVRRSIGACGIALVLAAGLLGYGPASAAEPFNCGVVAPGGQPVLVTTRLAGVPAVLRVPKVIKKPPIILWHGFGPPADERALMAALPLDDVPAVKVYLGLPLFGARSPAGGTEEMIRRQTQDVASLIFEPVVMGAAGELPAVRNALRARHCLAPGAKIGLFGIRVSSTRLPAGSIVFYEPRARAGLLGPLAGPGKLPPDRGPAARRAHRIPSKMTAASACAGAIVMRAGKG